MPFGKYQIVVFKEKGGGGRNIRLRAWFLWFLFFCFVALICANVWLVDSYLKNRTLSEQLEASEILLKDQNQQIDNIANKVSELQSDVLRVQQFDTKLKIMMNMENDVDTSLISDNFSGTYFPYYRRELMLRRINSFLKDLDDSINLEEVRQQELFQALRDNRELLEITPSIWPVEGFLSSRFGYRISPFTGKRSFHKGIDISARTGTSIVAPASGTVIYTGYDGAYGNTIKVQHSPNLVTRYAHLHKIGVKVGEIVKRGSVIGSVGSTGRSTGPHLHYEVILNGVPVDPMPYVLN